MTISTNISSMISIENSFNNNKAATESLNKLSSGFSINKASDNASGNAIADKLRTQKSSLFQSMDNANSALAMLQIADKAMSEQSNILDIVKQKLIQASSSTTSDEGRAAIGKSIHKLLTNLEDIAKSTTYNGVSLLQKSSTDGLEANILSFQIGETSDSKIKTTQDSIRSNLSGLTHDTGSIALTDIYENTADESLNFTLTDANDYMEIMDLALKNLNIMRSELGSVQNEVQSSLRNISETRVNIASAESVIRDVDYGAESMNFSKQSLMANASMFAQTQANAKPETVLQLLRY